MFDKILIANRGEIAVRIIKAAHAIGIKTVAIYSDADKEALHVKLADESVYIGPSPASQSYLVQEKIIEAAQKTKSKAIHPGYGFLSENASFAKLCKENSIEFIGPSPEAIRTMGDKITARKTMIQAGVPVVPGIEDFAGNDQKLLELAKKIGFPVMVKASAGGGGKGMRLVYKAEELIDAVRMAKGEAKSAFGNDTVYIEKFITSPHHIEFQILADKYGNTIHINERECSIQRRHQKVIEETPSPLITPEVRKKMGEAAIKAAKSVNYIGAGTIEFLVDEQLNFYFLEMNTRLQVEHPITEMTSGIDIVKQQIKIAAGKKLEIKQEQVRQNGHAIECRIYAEDTDNNFMPSPGKITYIKEPKDENIRIDGYVYSGFDIPIYYDPMIAKLIVWGKNREHAINNMKKALKNYKILGVKHNISFLYKILTHPKFAQGNYDTRFIDIYKQELEQTINIYENEKIYASITALIKYMKIRDKNMQKARISPKRTIITSNKFKINISEETIELEIKEKNGLFCTIKNKDKVYSISYKKISDNEYIIDTSDFSDLVVAVSHPKKTNAFEVNVGVNNYNIEIVDLQREYARSRREADTEDASNTITTPMPGKVVKILVKEGDKVTSGQNIIIVEAMKMQSEYKSSGEKTVKKVLVKEGDSIQANQPLVLLE